MTKQWAGFNVECFDTSRDTRQSKQMHDTFNIVLRTLLTCLLLLILAACSSRGAGGNAVSRDSNEAWFCQIDETGEAWDCVRDDELARSPVPRRLPKQPDAEPAVEPIVDVTPAESAADPQLTADSAPAETPAPPPEVEPAVETVVETVVETTVEVTPPESAIDPQSTADPAPADNAVPAPVERVADEGEATVDPSVATVVEVIADPIAPDQPKYLSMAYELENQTALTELPADLFVVQLMAMASAEKLASFLDVNELNDLTAARVEKDGELFYVLILGVYESEAIARDASAELPDALAGTQPWIRKLGSLQTAMIRANNLASSNEL